MDNIKVSVASKKAAEVLKKINGKAVDHTYNSCDEWSASHLEALLLQKEIAKAEWVASGSPRGEHPAFLAAMDANRAYLAEKRAQEEHEAASRPDPLSVLAERQAARERARKQDVAWSRAKRHLSTAFGWPRCGEGWGTYPGDTDCIRQFAVRGYTITDGRPEKMGVAS